ncbi:hypothetical protein PBI_MALAGASYROSE_77 [Mycobacterium phage MalagasyRose]|uniref:Uncharacterized protein n=1 Tax=Mycobacterium phage MalagasyRose TaxID=2599870 RepID=A0A5J6TE95_9CAUD|nr:hypothetical protein QEH39_gp11 [Mycobacterium phage MalagasyRose]QFG08925.1 hypothetical protein PBI_MALAGASYROSE_77 [Mycobacterium phage MalagasyRose]
MCDLGPFCSHRGGDRGKREPSDSDGLGCLENVYHHEDAEPESDPVQLAGDRLPLSRSWTLDESGSTGCATCDGGGCRDCID